MSIDALEDKGFFPEEPMNDNTYIAVGEITNRLEKLEKSREGDPTQFALESDTDKESFDGEGRRNRR